MTEPWQLGIDAAAAAIRDRELGVVEYVVSLLDRIESTDAVLHAWQHVDADGALASARRADEEIASGRWRGPLHGIPFGVKDVIDTAGVPTEGGSRAYAGRVPRRDAAAVAQLRANGAVLLGKTVTHEIAYGQNRPPTRNPWDRDRYPGGSSAGSGVAVAVGSAPGCLGTDTAGSIRNPASVNGLVGMRPTSGVVDCAGTMHLSERLDQVGPIARTVLDCAMLLDGISAGGYAACLHTQLPSARVGVDRATWRAWGVSSGVIDTVSAALDDLADTGVEIVDVELPELELGLPVTLLYCFADAARNHRDALARRPQHFDPATRVMLELGFVVTDRQLDLARRAQERVSRAVAATFASAGLTALASPTLAGPPPLLDELATDLTRDGDEADLSSALLLLSPANVCGLPGISVPCGFAAELPVGLHLLGRPHEDGMLLGLAARYEAATSWRTCRPPIWASDRAESASR